MNAIISRLLREATAPIVESSTRLVQKAVLVLFAVISLFVSWVFITVAFYAFLEPLIGHADTALSVAGLYLFASLIFLYSAKRQWPGRAHRPRAAESAKLMQDTAESNQEKADFVNNIDKSVAPFLDILQEAGMERERLALEAGAEVARQLTPFSLVTFAMAVGIIIGRLIGQEKSARP
jgi:Putative Actinobacterial Holin-X, holin superfamily III